MRKLLLNQLKLIAKENLIMLFLAILAKMSAQKSEARSQTFAHPGNSITPAGFNHVKASIVREPWLSVFRAFKNDSMNNKLITV